MTANHITILQCVFIRFILDQKLNFLHLSEYKSVWLLSCNICELDFSINLTRSFEDIVYEIGFSVKKFLRNYKFLLCEYLFVLIYRFDHLICAWDLIEQYPFNSFNYESASTFREYFHYDLFCL